VRLAHPLHGEVLRSALPELRRCEMLRAQVARLEARGLNGSEDQLRSAQWRLESGDEAIRTSGTRRAHRTLRARLPARRAPAAGRSSRTPKRGSAAAARRGAYELGSFAEAEAVLSEAQNMAETEAHALLLVTTRTKNLQSASPIRRARSR